jgi:hypothetical protein
LWWVPTIARMHIEGNWTGCAQACLLQAPRWCSSLAHSAAIAAQTLPNSSPRVPVSLAMRSIPSHCLEAHDILEVHDNVASEAARHYPTLPDGLKVARSVRSACTRFTYASPYPLLERAQPDSRHCPCDAVPNSRLSCASCCCSACAPQRWCCCYSPRLRSTLSSMRSGQGSTSHTELKLLTLLTTGTRIRWRWQRWTGRTCRTIPPPLCATAEAAITNGAIT